ncbi:hypothetical protein ACQCN2_01175 [Brevibacillus ginsengisoli]|uniref:hypothetical protein n=1 Tax=Brevibacillus ginsengisoli TaxID=363854 RepID=UPI003CF90CFB
MSSYGEGGSPFLGPIDTGLHDGGVWKCYDAGPGHKLDGGPGWKCNDFVPGHKLDVVPRWGKDIGPGHKLDSGPRWGPGETGYLENGSRPTSQFDGTPRWNFQDAPEETNVVMFGPGETSIHEFGPPDGWGSVAFDEIGPRWDKLNFGPPEGNNPIKQGPPENGSQLH